MLATENQHLKDKVSGLEEECKQHRRTIKALQTQVKSLGDLQQAIDKALQDNQWLEQQLHGRETELVESRGLLASLQRALETAQAEGE
jgi:cell division septum initiation protein DivIVA